MTHILLAEDDGTMRGHLARALERAGYAVTAVEDGDFAVEELSRRSFDLLVTDIMMPGIDGIELANRAQAIHPGMRVMFITGFAAVALNGGGLPSDAKLLSKPFHLRDLVAEVDRLFRPAEARDA